MFLEIMKGVRKTYLRPSVNEKNRARWRRWIVWIKESKKMKVSVDPFFWDLKALISSGINYDNVNNLEWTFSFNTELDLQMFEAKYDSEEFDDLSGPDTEDWHLAANLNWVPKKKKYTILCPSCGGRGETGGGFGSFDPPDTCPMCYGSGRREHPGPDTKAPPMPKDLVEYLTKCWRDFYAKKDEVVNDDKLCPCCNGEQK